MRAKVARLTSRLSKPYYAGIGEIIYQSARFEFVVQTCIWDIARLHMKPGRMLTVGMKIRPLLGILKNLVNSFPPSAQIKQEFNSIAKDAYDAIDARNALAHGIWSLRPGKVRAYNLTFMHEAQDRYLPKAQRLTAAQVQKLADAWERLNRRMDALRIQIHSVPPTSRDTQPPQP